MYPSYHPSLAPGHTKCDALAEGVSGAHSDIDRLLLGAQGLQPCSHPPGIPLLLVPAPSTAPSRHSAANGCHTHSLPYTHQGLQLR